MTTRPGDGRSPADELRRLAGPDRYRHNAFRVTGLPTTVTAGELRRYRNRLDALAEIGGRPPRPDSYPLADLTVADVRTALAALADPRSRIAHELLWWWGEDVTACGCDPQVHRTHDMLVTALLQLAEPDPPRAHRNWKVADWTHLRDHWGQLDPDGISQHLRTRARGLDDPRLREETVAHLLPDLSAAVLVELVEDAASGPQDFTELLLVTIGSWPVDDEVRTAAVEATAAPMRAKVEQALQEARALLPDAPVAAAQAVSEGRSAMDRLRAVAPAAEYRATAVLGQRLAVVLNNIWVAMYELFVPERGGWSGPSRWLAGSLLEDAESLATDSRTIATIARHRSLHEEQVSRVPSGPDLDRYDDEDDDYDGHEYGDHYRRTSDWMVVVLIVVAALGVLALIAGGALLLSTLS